MNDIKISEIDDRDWEGVVRLIFPHLRDKKIDELKDGKMVQDWISNFNQYIYSDTIIGYKAEIDNNIVGVITMYVLPRLELDKKWGIIEDFFVGEGHRGKGVGKALLTEILVLAKSKNLKQINLMVDNKNEIAKSLYTSLGFKQESIGMVYPLKPTTLAKEWFVNFMVVLPSSDLKPSA